MSEELVTLTIDDKEVKIAKGTNLIEAAKSLDVTVPFYCYHPHLSVPGNCRMCQLEVEGAPKLMIGCHTQVQEGMVVRTQKTSQAVKDAQSSTLEMILINHPLDCTVCDQAGHCKLQDYHFEYNAKSSRFLEEKEHKPKAVPLGETVMLDAERCIACTRCVRFCDEVTETAEIGLVNRGDKVTIAVKEGFELSNELSGTVVDLCPVGALTHKKWRFNTRIWYTKPTDSICPGCSTGCNVKVYERDGQVVQVKARLNDDVNKEWLCDEGRYGFDRFLPESRVTTPLIYNESTNSQEPVALEDALKKITNINTDKTLVLVAPNLLLEEYALLAALREKALSAAKFVVAYSERTLNVVEQKLVSPDYASNYQGAVFARLSTVAGELELQDLYKKTVSQVKVGGYDNILFVGDNALTKEDSRNEDILSAIKKSNSFGLFTDSASKLTQNTSVVFPARSILEKSGMVINRTNRLQFNGSVLSPPKTVPHDWEIIGSIAKALSTQIVDARADRDLTLSYLAAEPRLAGLKISHVKKGGVCLNEYKPQAQDVRESSQVSST